MGWIAGEEMDVCHPVTEEGMSTPQDVREDGAEWKRARKALECGYKEGRDGEGKDRKRHQDLETKGEDSRREC
jgi:hypothetical protein